MAIFLSVLKIIGWILLGLLGLILLLLFLLLFVPVRYKAKGHYDEDVLLDAKVTYLLHIVSVRFLYTDAFKMTIRIFGIPIRVKKKKKDKDGKEGNKDKDKKTSSDEAGETDENSGDKDSGSKDNKPDKKKKALDFINLLTEDSTKRAWDTCKVRLGKLLRAILPRKIILDIVYGLNDPYYTGIVLTIYDVLYTYLNKAVNIYPVYDEQTVRAKGKLRGHITLAVVLWHLLIVLLDKDCRAFYRKVKRK